jgi:hypothetical protein
MRRGECVCEVGFAGRCEVVMFLRTIRRTVMVN